MNYSEENNKNIDNSAKIRNSLKYLREHKLLPSASEVFKEKSDKKSLKAIENGNEVFYSKNKNYFKALEHYNRGLCLATKHGTNLAIGFAKRSEVYLKLDMYSFCLQNIELALESNCPENLQIELHNLRIECVQIMSSSNDTEEQACEGKTEINLSYLPNSPEMLIINKLQCINESKKYGRYIRACSDLYPGIFKSFLKDHKIL